MKNNKSVLRLLSLVLAIIMAVSVLAACGNQADDKTASSSLKSTAAGASGTASAAQEDPYEINYYYVAGGAQPDNSVVEAEVNKYLKETLKTNTTLKLNCMDWGTYPTKMKAMIAASESFDLCYAASWTMPYIDYINNGAFIAFDPYLDQVPEYKKVMGNLLEMSKIRGKNYVLPTKKEMAANVGLMYNKTLADKYNLNFSDVKTLEDLEPILKTFQEKEPNKPAFVAADSGIFSTLPWNNGSISFPVLVNGKYVLPFEQPEFLDMVSLMRSWNKAGYIPEMELTTQSGDYLGKGNFLVWCTGLKPGFAEERNPKNRNSGFEVATVDLTKPVMRTTDIFGSPTALSRSSKNPARAVKIYEYLCTDKYLTNLINYGIDGKHYTQNADGTITLVKDSKYYPGVPYELGNQTLDFILEGQPKDIYQRFEEFNKSATPAEDLGFIINPEPIKTEKAAIDTILKQYQTPLYLGMLDDKGFKEYTDKLKAAGIDKILQEYQKQFDAWKASN